MKHFLGPILGAEVAQKRAQFPVVVTRTEIGNANICILCDAVKNVERRVGAHTEFFAKTVEHITFWKLSRKMDFVYGQLC